MSAQCKVLRCPNPVGKNLVRTTPKDALRRVALVCNEHKAQIDAGSPWQWIPERIAGPGGKPDPAYGVIVMDADLDAQGPTITQLKGAESGGLIGPEGKDATSLILERRNGDGTCEEFRLTMTHDVAAEIAYALSRYFGQQRPSTWSEE